MWHLLCFLVPALAWTAQLHVEIRNSEVWVIRNGQERQLTHDGKSKLQAILSPGQNRIAYYEQCPVAEHCTPAAVILDLEGNRIFSFEPKAGAAPPPGSCGSILFISWVGDNAVAAECHINPSLSEYVETDLSTGRTTRDLLGYGFALSPDGKLVAHVGWVVHFGPPYQKSDYLQLDHTTVYPLPEGMSPVEQKRLTEPPKVVRVNGLTYSGIHHFVYGPVWSPDSQRVALVDCTYDWTADYPQAMSAGEGKESSRRCSLVVISRSGRAVLFPLPDLNLDNLRTLQLSWTSPHEVSLRADDITRTFTVP